MQVVIIKKLCFKTSDLFFSREPVSQFCSSMALLLYSLSLSLSLSQRVQQHCSYQNTWCVCDVPSMPATKQVLTQFKIANSNWQFKNWFYIVLVLHYQNCKHVSTDDDSLGHQSTLHHKANIHCLAKLFDGIKIEFFFHFRWEQNVTRCFINKCTRVCMLASQWVSLVCWL